MNETGKKRAINFLNYKKDEAERIEFLVKYIGDL